MQQAGEEAPFAATRRVRQSGERPEKGAGRQCRSLARQGGVAGKTAQRADETNAECRTRHGFHLANIIRVRWIVQKAPSEPTA